MDTIVTFSVVIFSLSLFCLRFQHRLLAFIYTTSACLIGKFSWDKFWDEVDALEFKMDLEFKMAVDKQRKEFRTAGLEHPYDLFQSDYGHDDEEEARGENRRRKKNSKRLNRNRKERKKCFMLRRQKKIERQRCKAKA